MRALTLAAAVTAAMISSSAYAKCALKDLTGTWAFDVGLYCGTYPCNTYCVGDFKKKGSMVAFKSKSCPYASPDISFEVRLRVAKNCEITGDAAFVDGAVRRENTIRGYLGAGGGMITAVTGSSTTSSTGRLSGMRVGN